MKQAEKTISDKFSRAVFAFCLLYFLSGLVLIAVGGNVTSHGYGLAVQDWPTTFGYNMFLVPPSMWVGVQGVFEEHGHRLLGAWLGFLAIISSVWFLLKGRNTRWLALGLLIAIIVQGLFGGFRVTTFFKQMNLTLATTLRIFHGVSAQLILSALLLLVFMESPWWQKVRNLIRVAAEHEQRKTLKKLSLGMTSLLLLAVLQLSFGAFIRHTDAGLAIPDYPLAYGQMMPPLSESSINRSMAVYAQSHEHFQFDRETAHTFSTWQIGLHWLHSRAGAGLILLLAFSLFWISRTNPILKRFTLLILIFVLMQAGLGISTLLFQRPPDLATVHQTFGALMLAVFFCVARLLKLSVCEQVGYKSGMKQASDRQSIVPIKQPELAT